MLGNIVALPKSLFPNVCENVVSIHCALTKTHIVFKTDAGCSLSYIATKKDELETILHEIYCQFYSGKTAKVFVTGPRKICTKIIAESIFHTQVCMVEDILATSKGFELISNHVDLGDIEYKYEGAESFQSKYGKLENSSMLNQIRKAMEVKGAETNNIDETKFHCPAILIMANSFINYYLVNKDKSIVPIRTICLGIGTLKGLAKCVTDLNIYDDIVTMAINGNRENVDNQVFELFSEDEKSPYGKLPPTLPLFPFGKCYDHNKGAENYSKDDLFGSLCTMVYNLVTSSILMFCRTYKVTTVYICGELFNADIFAKLVSTQSNLLQTNIKIKIIKSEYMLALGAMN